MKTTTNIIIALCCIACVALADSFSAVYPVPRTGQTISYRTGDDGDLRPGATWPDPRFVDNDNGTVTDNLTGLVWVKAPQSLDGNEQREDWSTAIDFCNGLVYAGHSDWRLPNINELESLVNCGEGPWGNRLYEWLNSSETPFLGVVDSYYWSGTSTARNINRALLLRTYTGRCTNDGKVYAYYVWPVRSGQGDAPSSLPKTGQTIRYRAGDDGDYEVGMTWPAPRFSDNGRGIVTDNLTGLEWIMAPRDLPGNFGLTNWNSAIDFCNELTYVEHADWRLPSRNELRSLIDYGKYSPALPDGHPFAGVYTDYELYWTSTAHAVWPESKWAIGIKDGSYDSHSHVYVWPVRAGVTRADHRSTFTNCTALAAGFILKWVPEYGWDSVVKCSTDLVNMPFTDLSTPLPYPVNSYTDTVSNGKCFYKVDLEP